MDAGKSSRNGLIEGKDYVIVSKEVQDTLINWYGIDIEVFKTPRFVESPRI